MLISFRGGRVGGGRVARSCAHVGVCTSWVSTICLRVAGKAAEKAGTELEEEEEMTAAPLGPARWRVLVAAREGWWTQLKCWAPRG